MLKKSLSLYKTSVGRKQIVAVTGLLLIGFIIGHLAGNLFFYGGPDAFNGYAEKLASLRPGLFVIEFALLAIFLIHMHVTSLLVMENIRARGQRYAVEKNQGDRSLATRLMPYTGTIILVFVIYHLLDFTFIDHHGPRAMLGGRDFGLYGVVYNSFSDPIHSTFYIIAMACLAFHLSHGVESFIQTFGFNHPRYTPMIKNFSNGFAVAIAIGYSSIPVYVMVQNAIR